MMYQHGVKTISEELDKVLRMWMNYFTVLFIEDEGCFRLTMKKDKETNKRKEFDDVRWIEACQEAGLARKKKALSFLKYIDEKIIRKYNVLLK